MSKIEDVTTLVERELRQRQVAPIDLAASCAYVALSQAVILGMLIKDSEIPANQVPTNAIGEVMDLLKGESEVAGMFRQIGGVLYTVASAANRTFTYDEVRGTFKINLGAGKTVATNPKLRTALGEIGYAVADGEQVRRVTLAAAWYYLFHRYQVSATRLGQGDATLEKFAELLPAKVVGCLKALVANKEMNALIA